jgi:hypothetical protein
MRRTGRFLQGALSLTGDGETTIAALEIVFDSAKLLLPVESGPIPGAASDGAFCNRVSLNRINVILFPADQKPIALEPTAICKLPFKLATPLSRGRTEVTAQNAECFNATGVSTDCRAESGAVSIRGDVASQPIARTILEREIHILLSADRRAPTVEQIASFDFSSGRPPPLAALTVESPFDADALIKHRASGDFLSYLRSYPNTARAKLERYAVVRYKATANIERALVALRREAYVQKAYPVDPVQPSEPKQASATAPVQLGPLAKSTANQYHLNGLFIPGLWQRAGGWSLVGILDSGLQVTHPNLRSFDGANSLSGNYTLGNFLPVYSFDFRYGVANVDERRPVPVPVVTGSQLIALYQECDLLDNVDDNIMTPTAVGHGTHVSGLVGARSTSANDMQGICKRCGLGMGKITEYICVPTAPREVSPAPRAEKIIEGMSFFNQVGAQIINASFGINQIFEYPGEPLITPPHASLDRRFSSSQKT